MNRNIKQGLVNDGYVATEPVNENVFKMGKLLRNIRNFEPDDLSNEERDELAELMATHNLDRTFKEFKKSLNNVVMEFDNQILDDYVNSVYESWNTLINNCLKPL